MRVIAGEAKRLKLVSPKGFETRPTSDITKETLFNVLAPYIYSDTRFLDLFAGSGAIGIEAVSRGAKEAVFVEKSKEALSCIAANLKTCRLEDRARIMKLDVMSALNTLSRGEGFDIIFMDPPYNEGMEKTVLKYIRGTELLKEDGLIVVESSVETGYDYVQGLGLEIFKEKRYRNNKHTFFRSIQ
ncbi:MAG: 16S rRNA (guanine(966)-N(2))-methyltransferase RsmD [Lachnospiraceae bacterium]|nr:16S rRNA (guanine(966)-N(2))-methyltransferase RsmD [Lachnospiraceae bacterium]